MRAVLLAALVGRLPLGSWQVNASVCRPTKGTGNIWRLAGKQAEGLEAATAFEALAHATIGEKEVTLCKVKLLEGSLHSVRLHAVALGYPVVGDSVYTGASRSFAGHPDAAMEPQLRRRLVQIHNQLLSQSQSKTEEKLPETIMLLPCFVRGDWATLNLWNVRNGASVIDTNIGQWRKHVDELSPLLGLPLLETGEGPQVGDRDPSEWSVQACTSSLPPATWEESCQCSESVGASGAASLWRSFQ